MYNVGDIVMYGTFGICKVTAIEKRDFTGEEQEYYILKHTSSEKNTFYVPLSNESALSNMHYVCSKAEVDELISHMNSEGLIWIDNDNKRKEEYSRIIKDADKHEIIRLIKTLDLRRKELAESGKNEMVGWHHRLDGHGFGWTLEIGDGQGGLACCDSWGRKELDGDGQGGLACCSSWGLKESDTTERMN